MTLVVEADLSGTAFGATPTWTDLSGWITEELSVTWGRQDWIGDVSPSELSFTLHNPDGRFTPGKASSPYYPHLKYGARVRYREVIGATTIYIFDGYVTDWTATPSLDGPWQTTVSAVDILGRFANVPVLGSYVIEEMLLDSPAWLYPLQESEGAVTFGDITGNEDPATIAGGSWLLGGVDAGQDVAAVATGIFAGTSVQVTNPTYLTWVPADGAATGLWLQFPVPPTSPQFTIEALVQITRDPQIGTIIACGDSEAGDGWELITQGAGIILFRWSDGTGSINQALPGTWADGVLHHFVITVHSDHKTVDLYADGTLGSTQTSVAAFIAAPIFHVVAGMKATFGVSTYPFTGAFAYVAYYPGTLSAARVTAHYEAATTAFSGESTDDRITRLLTYRTNLGTGTIDTGLSNMGGDNIDGQTLQQALLDVANTEAGATYADGHAKINFRSRSRLISPTTAVTLDASTGAVDTPSTFRDDIQGVRNDLTVARSGGSDQRVMDATHVTANGDYADSLTLNIDTDANALTVATFLLGLGTADQLATPNLTVNLLALLHRGDTTTVTAVLQLAPLDQIALSNLPTNSPSSPTLTVQGGTVTRSAEEFSAELYATPAV